MAIKDLLVPLTFTAGDDVAVDHAIAMADALQAHLTVLHVLSLPMGAPPEWGFAAAGELATLHERLRADAEDSARRWRERLARAGVSHDVRIEETLSDPAQIAPVHARYADLVVMAGIPQDAAVAALVRDMFGAMLLESGRPVLVVPPRATGCWPLQRAVIGWRPRRESARAVHDALPLLCLAGTVEVAMVEPVAEARVDGEEPGADVAAHLARHGLHVQASSLAKQNRTTATTLLSHAASVDAQLLVVGGYGHSRLREWALGGTTRELLRAAFLPVLFSH